MNVECLFIFTINHTFLTTMVSISVVSSQLENTDKLQFISVGFTVKIYGSNIIFSFIFSTDTINTMI